MLGDRCQQRQFLVAKLVRRIDHAEAQKFGILSDGHQRRVQCRKLGGDVGQSLLLGSGHWCDGWLLFLRVFRRNLWKTGGEHRREHLLDLRCLFRIRHADRLRGSLLHPPFENRRLFGGKLLFVFWRHVLVVITRKINPHKHEAVAHLAGNQRHIALAATGKEVLVGVHLQLALGLVFAVASHALRFEDRSHHVVINLGLFG